MHRPQEQDFPPGHPARFDYDPNSPEAAEWRKYNLNPKGERDFPRGHVKASDTPGNDCQVEWRAGVDPAHPEREEHTGRTPEQVEALRRYHEAAAKVTPESPVLEPTMAPQPPKPTYVARPVGQPGA